MNDDVAALLSVANREQASDLMRREYFNPSRRAEREREASLCHRRPHHPPRGLPHQ